MRRIIPALMIAILFSSCATHLGMISSGVSDRNIQYEDMAVGVAQTAHVFGIGGLSKDALVLQAKQNMMKSRPLKKDEMYMNFTVDFKQSYWFVYIQTKVTVSADVVKKTGTEDVSPFSPNYLNSLGTTNTANKLFEVGDSVIFDKTLRGTVVAVKKSGRIRVSYKTSRGNFKVANMPANSVFSPNKKYKGYRAGDMYATTFTQGGEDETVAGKVVGVGLQFVLVRSVKNGNLLKLEY